METKKRGRLLWSFPVLFSIVTRLKTHGLWNQTDPVLYLGFVTNQLSDNGLVIELLIIYPNSQMAPNPPEESKGQEDLF